MFEVGLSVVHFYSCWVCNG